MTSSDHTPEPTSANSHGKSGSGTKAAPVVAAYCATFLKPEMLHIYRQIDSLKRYRAVVIARKVESEDRFPFSPIIRHPKPWHHELRRFLNRSLLGSPNLISRQEARRLATILEGISADLIHIYFGNVAAILLPFLKINRLPSVVSFHGADVRVDLEPRAWRQAMSEMLSLATLILARSESLARSIEGLGADPSKIRIQRTGIPLKYLHRIERRPPENGEWRILQACRLIAKKGLKTSLRAFATFKKLHPAARLVIAGDGPMLDELHALAAELAIADNVDFTGFLDQSALREQYAESHIFLHPSETPSDGNVEGIPNSMLEAMATGLPVVATRHGGIPEAVREGEGGLLFDERDVEGIAAGLATLTRDPALYERMSQFASEAVGKNFDIRNQIPLLESHYDEARALHSQRVSENAD